MKKQAGIISPMLMYWLATKRGTIVPESEIVSLRRENAGECAAACGIGRFHRRNCPVQPDAVSVKSLYQQKLLKVGFRALFALIVALAAGISNAY